MPGYIESPDGGELLHTSEFDLNTLINSSTLTIPFQPAGRNLAAGDYYLELETQGGVVRLLGRNEDAYAQGQLYRNHLPIDGDLSFRLSYIYGLASVWDDVFSWFKQAWLVLPLLILLWLPGRLLLRLTRIDENLDWGERSAISIGLSLSVVPLLMLWTSLIHLPWSQTAVRIFSLLLILVYGFLLLRSQKNGFHWRDQHVSWPMIALGAVFAFSLAVRLAMVRDLAGPAWVDSVHHALITRLILAQGSLPDSYAPFLQVSTTNYHTGFHTLLAAFTWLSGLKLEQAMLIFGQVLNASAVLAVYLLTKSFTKSQLAGIYAAITAGLLTPMPAYYTSWGRYTQLAGLLILPAAWWFIKYLLDRGLDPLHTTLTETDQPESSDWLYLALGGMALGGVLLVHYRVFAFLIALLMAYLAVYIGQAVYRRRFREAAQRSIFAIGGIGLIAVMITLPWWPSTLSTFIKPVASAPGGTKAFADFSWSYLNTASGKYVLGLAGIGLVWSFVQKRWFGLVMALWAAIMFFFANLGALHLPGGNMINNTSVAISLFLPCAVLSGYLIGWLVAGWAKLIPADWRSSYWAVVCLGSAALAFVGARALLPILNPGTLMIRQADLPAIAWIDENIPEDETFLINPFLWGYGLFAGSDGGYWISPLAGRNTLPPAALYNYNFTGDQGRKISADVQQVLTLVQEPDRLAAYLIDKGIRYIYLGARGGPLSSDVLVFNPQFQQIYHQDGVSIFKVLPLTTP